MTMKTLDEVIKGFDCCQNVGCNECPYKILFNDYTHVPCDQLERDEDALHYLKEYRMMLDDIAEKRKKLESEIDRYQEAVRNCEEAKNKYRKAEQDALKTLDNWASRPVEENKKLALTVDNPPISWEELRQMAGKPVWVEGEHGFIWNHRSWVLIDPYDENDDLIICHGTDTGHYEFVIGKEDYGRDWQAYRKERV